MNTGKKHTGSTGERIKSRFSGLALPAAPINMLVAVLAFSIIAAAIYLMPSPSTTAWGRDWPGQAAQTTVQIAQQPAQAGSRAWDRWRERALTIGAADAQEPIQIDGRLRHPVIFFGHAANRRWAVFPIFSALIFISAIFKIFLPGITSRATMRCRTNIYASLSSAFIYATIVITVARYSFLNEDLAPMGIFSIGLLQMSFVVGSCLATNLFAENIYNLLTRQCEPTRAALRVLIFGSCLTAVALILTGISVIPDLGHLPRIGNRIVMLVAALGLGGLVNVAASWSKARPQDSSGPV